MRFKIFLLFLIFLSGCHNSLDTNSAPGPNQIVRLSDSEIKGLDPQKISDLSSLRVAGGGGRSEVGASPTGEVVVQACDEVAPQ